MQFVYPEFLWAFLALAIPVIIHLFNFRKYKTLYFSNLKFLQFIDEETKATKKLKHYLVLTLRILIFSFAILAFAQPIIAVKNNGQSAQPVIAIYIDNSFSMTAKGTEGELISEARETAKKIVDQADLKTSFLVCTNLLSGVEKRLLTKAKAVEYIDKIEPTAIPRKMQEIINWQRAVIENENKSQRSIGAQQYVLLSDFQKVASSGKKLTPDEVNFYHPVQLVPQNTANLFIDSVWFSSPIHKLNENNELNVRVINKSDENLSNVELKFRLNDIKRDYFLDIQANNSATTIINYSDAVKGIKNGTLTLNDQQLFWDDDFYFSYEVKDFSNLLIIDGPAALSSVQLVYSLEKLYNVKTVSENSFVQNDIKNVDLIVLNGLNEITNGFSEQLNGFIQNGGSIAVFPGDKINPSSYNNLLSKLELPSISGSYSQGLKVKKIQYKDLFFQGMFDKQKQDLNLMSIKKAYGIRGTNAANYFSIIELQNGEPLLVRSRKNANHYLFCSSLSADFGTFSSESLFPAVLLRMAELSQRNLPLFITIGDESKFPVFNYEANESPLHLKSKTVDFIPRTSNFDGTTFILLNGMEAIEQLKAGNYSITSDQEYGNIAVNYNRQESQTTYLSKSEITEVLSAAGLKNIAYSAIENGQSMTNIDIKKPFEYWRLCLFLALLFLTAELLVLKFWK
ncbi:MAG: BatA domain-containing protein [Bacteroidota bacterium]